MKRKREIGTRIVGLMGYPVEHSLSPIMHNLAFKSLGLPFSYHLFSVKPSDLKKAIDAVRILGFAGLNITIPHKVEVMKYLDSIERSAHIIGAVNTISNCNGKLIGYNTDGDGFLLSLLEELKCSPRGKNCLLVGAGGAGMAIGVKILEKNIERLTIVDKIDGKAKRLADNLKRHFPLSSVENILWKRMRLNSLLKETDILINATPCGMNIKDTKPVLDISSLRKDSFVFDVIYNRTTPLIKMARKRGIKAKGGIGMLIHQGACAFKIWTGRDAPIDVMKKALKHVIGDSHL